jgi:hypothetical protein
MSNPGPASTVGNDYAGGASPYVIGPSATSLVGVWGATPVAQSTPSGNTHTVAAGSTTAVYTNTTFDGGIGSTAYTVGDIVAALKLAGWLKA